jgi:hypothetical protein
MACDFWPQCAIVLRFQILKMVTAWSMQYCMPVLREYTDVQLQLEFVRFVVNTLPVTVVVNTLPVTTSSPPSSPEWGKYFVCTLSYLTCDSARSCCLVGTATAQVSCTG